MEDSCQLKAASKIDAAFFRGGLGENGIFLRKEEPQDVGHACSWGTIARANPKREVFRRKTVLKFMLAFAQCGG